MLATYALSAVASGCAETDESSSPEPFDVQPQDPRDATIPDVVTVDGDEELDSAMADVAALRPDDAGGSDASTRPPPPLPARPWPVTEPGPYRVGYRKMTPTVYVPDGQSDADARELRTVVWYPTRATEGDPTRYMALFARPEVLGGAPLGVDAPAPLLLFSHGNASFAEQSFFFTEFMATHGWVVVAFDHTGNTFRDPETPDEIIELRPQDVSAVIDRFLDLPADDPLYGLISDQVAVAGHSFGGYTTLAVAGARFDVDAIAAACESGTVDERVCAYLTRSETRLRAGFNDPRVKIAIPMTPFGAPVFGAGLADIDIPVVLMTGQRDITLPNASEGDPIWAALDGPDDMRVDMVTAGHFTFTNLCDAIPGQALDDGCGEGFMPPERAFRVINAYALAAARKHLLGDDAHDALLQGSEPLEPDDVALSWKR